MRQIALLLLTLTLLSGCASTSDNMLAVENVTVIDATGAPARPGVTVVIDRGRIRAIAPSNASVPRSARRIDGTGKFLIPGLWDMHTHLSFYGPEALSMMVRHGILAVRDLGGSLEELDRWRAEIDRGERIGPRIFRAGPYVDGSREFDSDENGALRKATTIMRIPGFTFRQAAHVRVDHRGYSPRHRRIPE